MRIPIINKSIQQRLNKIGIQGENNVEEILFVLPKMYNDIDLSTGIAYMYAINANKETVIVKLDSETEYLEGIETGNIILKWLIGSEVTQSKGMLNVQIVINGLNNELWKSEISTFTVSQSIHSPTTLPIMYNSNDVMPLIQEPENEAPITISNRKFFIPAELKNIAVQNDENSEAVKIIMPRYFDGHDLSKYTISLKSVSSGGRADYVFLNNDKSVQDKEIHLYWTLKTPQTSYDGTLQIQIFVTGENFKWETEIGEVNILASLDAEPVIPNQPDFIADFLREIQSYLSQLESNLNEAKQYSEAAKGSADLSSLNKDEATRQAEAALQYSELAKGQAVQSQTSATVSEQNAQKAAESAELAKQIKDSTEIFYDIDAEGNRVGFRRANEDTFTYTPSLKGDKGEQGIQGIQGLKGDTGASIEYQWQGTSLGIKNDTEEAFTFVDLKGQDGTVSFDDLTEEQKLQLKGEAGLTVSVNGVTHVDGNITLKPDDIGAASSSHVHDDRYYTKSELDNKIGDTEQLLTVDKTSLVNAINELKRTGGGGGATLNVFKATGGTWGEYIAESATNTFTIDNFNGVEKTADLYYESVPLIPNKHFTIGSSGEVTLAFQLDVGETIDYCISDVSFDYNELANKPDFDGLSGKVNVLNNDRGYLVAKSVFDKTSLDDICENGIYYCYNTVTTDLPEYTNGYLIVYSVGGNDYLTQEYILQLGNEKRFIRRCENSKWSDWQQIATTDKLTPKNDSNFDTFVANSFNVFSRYGISNSKFPSTSEMLINGISISRDSTDYTLLLGANMYGHGYGKKMIYKIGNDSWQQIATTTKTEIPMAYASGYVDDATGTGSSSIVKVNNTVRIIANIRREDGGYFTYSSTSPIFTLPSGYRPTKNIRLISAGIPYGGYGAILITTAGNVFLRSVSITNMTCLMFTIEFEV